jgi:hypothetical protein
MEQLSISDLDQVAAKQQAFESDLRSLTEKIRTEFARIAENAEEFTGIYAESVESMLGNVETLMEQMKEFMGRCEALEQHLVGLEVLSKQIGVMRRLCEDLELKTAKLGKS